MKIDRIAVKPNSTDDYVGRRNYWHFTARRSYASAVLVVVILSGCLFVCHTRAL